MRRGAVSMALTLLVVLAGCGGGAPPDGSNNNGNNHNSNNSGGTAPVVSQAQATPATLTFVGGPVTLSAAVQATSAVSRVWAQVTKPDATTEEIDMALAGTTYSATWSAPANTNAAGQSATYSVVIRARDSAGIEAAASAVTVTVAAAPAPPQQPGI